MKARDLFYFFETDFVHKIENIRIIKDLGQFLLELNF